MCTLWRVVDWVGFALRDTVLFLIGHRCIPLGEWPDQGIAEAATGAVSELGEHQVKGRDFGLALDIENLYFRVRGYKVRLCIEEYGQVTLWGPKGIVTDLSKRIKEKLVTNREQTGGPRSSARERRSG